MYKPVIGLEVHCELETKSKNFSPAPNEYIKTPNINVATVDLGLPGVLPVVNKQACVLALKTALALNCQTPNEITFDRKNYFYPDLPKGYQITQMKKPMGRNGFLKFFVGEVEKKVDIHQLHLEEDTASLEHFKNYSLIDYNRSGIPLIEIVTEPCLYSAEEAVAFLESLRDLFLYCEVSEAKSDKGQMRCDVNISLMKEDAKELGTKVEIKNINSFTNVSAAIEYEIKRQTKILEAGDEVIQETRRIGEDLKTHSMRDKVDAVDYKYFQEPNIPSIKIEEDFILKIKKNIPKLQYERIMEYKKNYNMSHYDAVVISKEKGIANYFEESISYYGNYDKLIKWVSTIVLGSLNKLEISLEEFFITPKMLAEVAKKVVDGELSELNGKQIIYDANREKRDPLDIIETENVKQITDEDKIVEFVVEAIEENQEQVEEYFSGKDYVANFFVGKVMQKTNKQADPKLALKIIREQLEKRR